MWVSTSFLSALNFLPHQVRSAFQLSICPPSSRMKRKFPCSAHGGTFSGLARYNLGPGSKDWAAKQPSSEAATKPIRPMVLTIRTRCVISSLQKDQDHTCGLLVLMPACEFAQQKLLGHTEGNMEAHAGAEVSEYKPSTAFRVWVVG